jgi:outer membrane protein OmpA-like peptidoglycan-associated protein
MTRCLFVTLALLAACRGSTRRATDGGPAPTRIVMVIGDDPAAWPGLVADFTAANLEVTVRPMRGARERLNALESGAADIEVMTVDGFAQLAPEWTAKGAPLEAFLVAAWDRGALGVAVTPKARTVEALRDAKAAVVRRSPGHFLIWSLLEASGLPPNEKLKVEANLLFEPRAQAVVDAFRHDEAQAAALFEPHLHEAIAGGKGRLLVTTATASGLVPSVLFARASFLAQRPAELAAFAHAWDQAVRAIEKDPAVAAQAIGRTLEEPPDEVKSRMARVRYATRDDSRALFQAPRAGFSWLFEQASKAWRADGMAGPTIDPATARWTRAVDGAADPAPRKFVNRSKAVLPFATRVLALRFDAGSDAIEPPARELLDGVGPWLLAFGDALVRVETNTEDLPPYREKYLSSKRRAQAIVDYLATEWGIARERLRGIGNGPEQPIASNATDEGRERNRRTEVMLFANE